MDIFDAVDEGSEVDEEDEGDEGDEGVGAIFEAARHGARHDGFGERLPSA